MQAVKNEQRSDEECTMSKAWEQNVSQQKQKNKFATLKHVTHNNYCQQQALLITYWIQTLFPVFYEIFVL
jgi:hypothetical protein